MSDFIEDLNVLVPVDLSESDWGQLEPCELLSSANVVLLGLYPIKDQVSLAQAREQLGEKAVNRLNTLAEKFKNVGVEVDSQLVFSEDFSEAINRVGVKKDCNATMTWNRKMVFDRIGALVKCKHGIDHVINAVAWLMIDQNQEMDLVHFLEEDVEEEARDQRRSALEASLEYLCDQGIDRSRLNLRMEIVDDPNDAMVNAANEYDALVMGETEETVRSIFFGHRHELVEDESDGPVLIVRNPREQ